ncbi:hypothetical protein [Paracoccus nototheniae]|uniref:Uncharacterized protein n=1 Tax=Paracoccus nototheniae TaxID=2489002 RepID=A0ABW4DYA0_9RHOB|nr:hypothetical protein [Paracoccus nototheniae]
MAHIDRSAMGTTVQSGTRWPLNRQRMTDDPGFPALVDNACAASQAIALAMGPVIQTHNITPGMPDPKGAADNTAMVDAGIGVLSRLDAVLNPLVIDEECALEELNSGWTAMPGGSLSDPGRSRQRCKRLTRMSRASARTEASGHGWRGAMAILCRGTACRGLAGAVAAFQWPGPGLMMGDRRSLTIGSRNEGMTCSIAAHG